MTGLKLGKLPDRTPVKLTISVSPDLKRTLDRYAEIYRATYDADESLVELVPAMLLQFLESDRAFVRSLRDPAP